MFANYVESKFDSDLKKAQAIITKNLAGTTQQKISKAIIKYVIDHNLVLRDVESFLNDTDVVSSKQLTIIGFDIFIHANNIANLIAKQNIYVLLYTNVKNRDFTIMVDKLPYINLYNMKINILDTSKTLIYYPAELELVIIYRTLYSPNNFDEWETCNKHRNVLERMVRERAIYSKLSSSAKIAEDIVLKMAKESDMVLVGSMAASMKTQAQSTLAIQAIASEATIHKVVSELSIHFANIEVKVYDISLYVMPELRLTKTNIMLKGEAIASFFNNIEYELIPYEVINGYKIGDVYVILCHLLIDYYTYKKNAMPDHAKACVKYFEQLKHIKPIELPQYLGIYSELSIYRRKKGTYNEYEPYSPEDVRFNTGSYREIKFKGQH